MASGKLNKSISVVSQEGIGHQNDQFRGNLFEQLLATRHKATASCTLCLVFSPKYEDQGIVTGNGV